MQFQAGRGRKKIKEQSHENCQEQQLGYSQALSYFCFFFVLLSFTYTFSMYPFPPTIQYALDTPLNTLYTNLVQCFVPLIALKELSQIVFKIVACNAFFVLVIRFYSFSHCLALTSICNLREASLFALIKALACICVTLSQGPQLWDLQSLHFSKLSIPYTPSRSHRNKRKLS